MRFCNVPKLIGVGTGPRSRYFKETPHVVLKLRRLDSGQLYSVIIPRYDLHKDDFHEVYKYYRKQWLTDINHIIEIESQ